MWPTQNEVNKGAYHFDYVKWLANQYLVVS